MSERLSAYHALLREDLFSFIAKCFSTIESGKPLAENWHLHHIAWHLAQVQAGESRRLIINIPPRHLKSICVSVAFPAWLMGHDPSLKIIAISYASELARKHAADFQLIVNSPWYHKVFPAFEIKGARKGDIFTSQEGARYARSVGGGVLGLGADLIILDDPINAPDALSPAERQRVKEFYDNTAYTRLNDKARGSIIIVMQRLHADDLVGHVQGKENWQMAVIPAIETERREYRIGPYPQDVYLRRPGDLIFPDREGPEVLQQIRRNLGSMNFSAQYQQEPVPPEGNVIKREWIRYYDTRPPFDFVVTSWDTASTIGNASDYSVGTVWGVHQGNIYLIDVIRGQMEYPDLKSRIESAHHDYNAHATLIEGTDLGRAMVQSWGRGGPMRGILRRPRFEKETRLLQQSSKFEAGQVLLPREAPWLADYMVELLAFPNGAHDDQVDSTSQALNWLSNKISRSVQPVRPNPKRPPGARRRPPGAS